MARTPKPSGQRLPDKGKSRGRRKNNARPLRARFLIVCEGKATEKHYFESFRDAVRVNARIEVRGLGKNTLDLVDYACKLRAADTYTQVWCVFDRDSFPAEQFNAALNLAQRNEIQVAYSNEAFELWYLLHFEYHDTAYHRSQYQEMLTARLEKPYHKASRELYRLLVNRQPTAIRHAQALLDSYGPNHIPERDNPCTTVHKLVLALNACAR